MPLPGIIAAALPYVGAAAAGYAGTKLAGGGSSRGGGNALTGTPGQAQQFKKFTPQQQALQNLAIQQAQQALGQAPSSASLSPLMQLFQNPTNQLQALQNTFNNPGANPLAALLQLQQQGFKPDNTASLLNQTLGNLQGNRFSFDPIESQARADFSQKTLPSIAERFTAMGGQRSGAFGRTLGAAGSDLERQLAALRSQYALQERGMDQGLLQNLLANRLGSQAQQQGLAGLLGQLGLGQQGLRQTGATSLGQLGLQQQGLRQQLAQGIGQLGLGFEGLRGNYLQNLLGASMQPQFDTAYFPGSPGLLQPLLGGAGQGLGNFAAQAASKAIFG